MALSNIELYEALRTHIGDDGARLIVESLPQGEELVTKPFLRAEFEAFRGEMRAEFQALRAEFAEFKAETRGWMLQFFVPLWLGMFGLLGAMVIHMVRT